ncbi:PadR family transcriptional regulator [Labrys wisconsinensis]|uniref:DNA-binding PadR family transcriptional regulator n=1 Tax=Labrys wisconsinensis TaxID=425677 RepID=A0ABU0J8B7_9HYPH|nr:PadR family transcriptional regulator [Labrys wisconsinensis]MDQ0469499.1 DNA-binding PadR family transcriptional regulator [Labrys wisconsinensis]
MSRRKVSNPLALAALACLAERSMHPYEIAVTLRERRKDDSVRLNYGSLYTIVQSLERHGLIQAEQTERPGARPERTVYAITAAGRHELLDWLSELTATPAKEFVQFEAALSFLPILSPEEAAALLEERCRRLELELAQDRGARDYAGKQGLPRLFAIESEYRSALKQAELDWTRALAGDIREDRLDGLELWRTFHREPR